MSAEILVLVKIGLELWQADVKSAAGTCSKGFLNDLTKVGFETFNPCFNNILNSFEML